MFTNPNQKLDGGKVNILKQQQFYKQKILKREFGQTKSASLQHGADRNMKFNV